MEDNGVQILCPNWILDKFWVIKELTYGIAQSIQAFNLDSIGMGHEKIIYSSSEEYYPSSSNKTGQSRRLVVVISFKTGM